MRILVSAILFVALAAGPLGAQAPDPPATIPFEMLANGKMHSGHIAVQATINGQGPYRLIFDTGAPMMLLSTRAAKEAGLLGSAAKKPAPRTLFSTPGQVTIEKLEIGGLTAANLPAVALDHPTVAAMARVFGPIDGIVGFPFFARYRTSIDYQAKQLVMSPNGYQPADVMQSLMNTLMARSRDRNKPTQPRMLVPAAQWGFRVEKDDADDEAGVTIAEVFPGSAAAKAGFQPGDRLLTLDGRWTDSEADVFEAVAGAKDGQTVEIRFRRAGKDQRLAMAPFAGF